MKTYNSLFGALLATIIWVSCTNNQVETNTNKLELHSDEMIFTGHPVLFKFQNWSQKDSIEWHVNPTDSSIIKSNRDYAEIIFAYPGNYQISASAGNNVQTNSITVDLDTTIPQAITHPDSLDKLVEFKNETLHLNITLFDTSNVMSIAIAAQTSSKFKCKSTFIKSTVIQNSDTIYIEFNGVQAKYNCIETNDIARGYNSISMPEKKNYSIRIISEGKIYEGKLKYDGSKSHLDWDYKSGVIINSFIVKP